MFPKQLNVLTDEQISQIVDAAFEVLEKTGCRFDSGWTRKRLKESGCKLDDEKSVVLIPRSKMETYLKDAPRFDLEHSDAALHLPGASRYMMLDPGAVKSRPALVDDVKDVIRISNVLEGIDVVSAGVLPTDVPDSAADAMNAALLFQYSKKPFAQQPYSRNGARAILSMAEVYCDGRDEMRERGETGYLLATSGALRFSRISLELARMYAALGLPVIIGSRGRMGRETPDSVFGALVMLVAEFMAGVAYIMVSECPSRMAFSDGMTAIDPNGNIRWFGTEQILRLAAGRQIADKMGFVAAPLPAESDYHSMDFLAAYEKCLSQSVQFAAGADVFAPSGNLPESFSIPQLVLDAEGACMMKRISRGIEFDDVKSTLDEIKKAGAGGNFFAKLKIVKGRQVTDQMAVLEKQSYDSWRAAGAKESREAAEEKTRDLLDKTKLEPAIDEDIFSEIQNIIDNYIEKCRNTQNTEISDDSDV